MDKHQSHKPQSTSDESQQDRVSDDSGEQPAKTSDDSHLKHAGRIDDLPEDASEQLDHYLYGTSKR